MDNLKDDNYYVESIIDNLKIIINNSQNMKKEDLDKNSILCDALLFRIVQISENSAKLSDDYKNRHSDVPWRAIRGMRKKSFTITVKLILRSYIRLLQKTSRNCWRCYPGLKRKRQFNSV